MEQIGGKPLATGSQAAGPRKAGIATTSSSSSNSNSSSSANPPPWDPYCCSERMPRSQNNVAIRWFPGVSENEPTVVANPRDPQKLVAGTHFIGDTKNRCVAHYSRDGGKTWNPIPIHMPQLAHETECSDPVLAYSPDGSRVYYAYLDIDFATTFKVLVSYSDDDGRTWKGPIVALQAPTSDYDKPWIGTHVPIGGGGGDDDDDNASQSNRNWVYVSATRFDFSNTSADCHIDFTRSSNKGMTWSPPQTLDSGNCSSPGGVVVPQGSRPQGGLDRGVIVAWYNSGADGFRTGSFQIRTRYSADNGATFAPTVIAANDAFELQLFLGPGFAYHRWWGGMFPDVEIAQNGSAHILYTHDPENGSTIEDGDIRYIGSATPPYAAWSAPTTVNDDTSRKAQGWATLEAISKGQADHPLRDLGGPPHLGDRQPLLRRLLGQEDRLAGRCSGRMGAEPEADGRTVDERLPLPRRLLRHDHRRVG